MIAPDLSAAILHTATQIADLKQQLEATPKDKLHLQHQLKELQLLQLWQLSQERGY
jgi:hypothetical protein